MDVQAVAGSAGVSSATQIELEYQARVVALQKNAINQVGEETLKLLQSATITDPAQGRHIDLNA